MESELALGGLAALLILIGVATEVLFVVASGLWQVAGVPAAAGTPVVAAGGGVAFLVGSLLAGRGRDGQPYATREVVLVLSGGASVALGVALVLAVARSYPAPALVGLLGAGSAEALVAVGLGLRLATQPERRAALFGLGALLGLLGAGFHLIVCALSL